MICPLCGEDGAMKVIYCGLPVKLCANDRCNCMWGFWSKLAAAIPIATDDGYFAFMAYEGSYLKALWHWLTNPED